MFGSSRNSNPDYQPALVITTDQSAVHIDLPFGPNVAYDSGNGIINGTYVVQDFGEGFVDPNHFDHGKPATLTGNPIDEDLYYSIDFALSKNTPVLAQGSGEIISLVDDIQDGDTALASDGSSHADHGFGNYVTIRYDLPNGQHLYATYMHLEQFQIPYVHPYVGEEVSEGDVIGRVGQSGKTTGPHLHVTYGVQQLPENLGSTNPAYAQTASYAKILIADGRYDDNPEDGPQSNPLNGPVFFNNTAASSGHPVLFAAPSLTNGHLVHGQTLVASRVSDGYVADATVFVDANKNGQQDAGELSTTTDGNGDFVLGDTTAPLIAIGGVDISTGLTLKGQLSAPSGSTDITPLTTLLVSLTSDQSAQQNILSALGLSSILNLGSFDPIAAAQLGSADGAAAQVAGAKVYDTVETIASTLAGAGGSLNASFQSAFAALASALDGSGVNLNDTTALSGLIAKVAQTEGIVLKGGVADSVASVIAAGNAALDHVLQVDQPGAQLLTDTAGIELVMQGAASTAITNAAGNPTQLQTIANLFTGTNLSEMIAQGQTEAQNPGQDLGPIAFNGTLFTDQNTVLSGSVSAVDLAAHTIAYALDGSTPTGLTFNLDGTFSFDPRGTYEYLALGQSTTLSFRFTASDGQGTASTGTETITINGLNDPPVIDSAHTTATGTITELPNTTGSNAIDSKAGVVAFADPDLTDRPTATIDTKDETVTYQDASGHTYSLTPAQILAFEKAIQITPETDNTNAGEIDWTYNITDKALDFLGVRESLTVTAPIVIDDHNGGTVTQNVLVTINGSNDNPIAVPDSNGVARAGSVSENAANGVLANDNDPDIHDKLTVEAVDGRTGAVGQAIGGEYGSLTLNADGSYTYVAYREGHSWDDGHENAGGYQWPTNDDNFNLAGNGEDHSSDGGIAQDVFNYTVSDGHGGLSTSTLSFVVFDRGTTYLSGADTTLTAGKGSYVLDGSAGGDTLKAGNGNAVLIGGNGDTLVAGKGEDTFLFRPDFGANTIKNFGINEDTLQFDNGIFKSVHDILAHTTDTAAGAVISDGHGDTVTLSGVTAAQLHAHEHDFHLV
jgi:VCBS repeat-containing protein